MTATSLKWKIRYAEYRDTSDIARINRLSFQPPTEPAAFHHQLASPEFTLLVADLEDEVIGYASFSRDVEKFVVEQLAVDPTFRRLGIGSSLIEHLIVRLKGKRREWVEGIVSETNLGGQLFLKSCGFMAIEIMRDFVEEYHDAFRFSRSLYL